MPDAVFLETFAKMLPYFIDRAEQTARAAHEDFDAFCEREGCSPENASAQERWVCARRLGERALKFVPVEPE